MGTKFFRSAIEDGTTTGTRFRRSGPVEFANQTSESVVEIADFTFVENQKSILQNATLSVLVCFIDSSDTSQCENNPRSIKELCKAQRQNLMVLRQMNCKTEGTTLERGDVIGQEGQVEP
ncbi:hypothetical protein LXL04_031727 [Taraxacum kok-saghyz]